MTVTLIAAVARNGVIGNDGDIPWRVPGEQLVFKDATMGHTLLMGRATYESIGRPLPGRTTIVLTRDPGWHAEGVTTAASIEEALGLAHGEVYVAGGAAVYAAALPYADAQLLSEIPLEPDGDTFYPPFDEDEWPVVRRDHHDGFDVALRERRARTVSAGG